MKKLLLVLSVLLLTSCLGMPDKVKPVNNFELNKYLGKWYEIARLDHSFERGLSNVSASYSLNKDGSVKVLNKGFLSASNEWQEAEGKAYFVDSTDEGYLKVSFFGPFYGSYVVFELDHEGYQYAFVSGPNNDYLWLLARTSKVPPAIVDKFISMSQSRGFNTNEVIWVEHDQ
ncbi:lipocalin family protein [Colwellia sp. RSH04]|uniref:lipocalin family protein n=1 Tax=Colwellia sp. RSH04 TaxID=2305464 RepID=UPI000E593A20|nr:lipocalin family protein [Colwellia sp. RSH04]RHW75250.1 lipocalin [Colwellia sp. RSH04]